MILRNLAFVFASLGLVFGLSIGTVDAQITESTENILIGKITDTSKTAKPIIGRAVRLLDTNGVLAGLAISDSNGNYRLSGFKTGTYTIFVPDEMGLVKKKYVKKVTPTSITIDSETGFNRTVDIKVKAPTKVTPVGVRVMDPNSPGVPISGATIQYKPVVGTKAKVTKAVTPATLAKLKPGCYSFTATKLVGYYLSDNQATRLVCFDQYGPTGGGEGYQVVFFQTKIDDARCDKQAQTGIDDFWFCGKKARDTLQSTHPLYTGYSLLWKHIVTRINEYRSAYTPNDTPQQIRIESEQVGLDNVVKSLSEKVSTTTVTCPLPRQAVPATNGIPNPDDAERISFAIDTFGYPMLDATKKKFQPHYQKYIDAQIAYLWAYTRDWRLGGCKNFASTDTSSRFNQLYTELKANYPDEMDDTLNLNRYLGAGEVSMYPAPRRYNDPTQFYAVVFSIGSTLRADFDANVKAELNNANSTKYKAGAADTIKAMMAEVMKK